MGERLIYRPNAFTVEQWEALTREEQILWWKKDREAQPPRPPFNIFKLLKVVDKITPNELAFIIIENLTEENTQETLVACSPEIMEILREFIADLPQASDDAGWSERLYLRCVSFAPWTTDEEIQQSLENERKRFRNGVRHFRAFDPGKSPSASTL